MFLGQSIFTPQNLTLKPPDPRDRPYAAWLYAGTSLLQESNRHMLENLELDLGVVGPGVARQTNPERFSSVHRRRPGQGLEPRDPDRTGRDADL